MSVRRSIGRNAKFPVVIGLAYHPERVFEPAVMVRTESGKQQIASLDNLLQSLRGQNEFVRFMYMSKFRQMAEMLHEQLKEFLQNASVDRSSLRGVLASPSLTYGVGSSQVHEGIPDDGGAGCTAGDSRAEVVGEVEVSQAALD